MTDWIQIDRDILVRAVEMLNLVPQRAGIPASDYVRVSAVKSGIEMALASSVSGVVRVKAPGFSSEEEFFIDRRVFVPFVLAGKTWKGDFQTAFSDAGWLLKQGSRRAEFAIRKEKVSGYGKWRDRTGLQEVKLSEGMRRLLLASFNCATADPAMPHLNCVYLGGQLVLATNQVVLFLGLNKRTDKLRFPFPVEVIPLLGEGLVDAVGLDGDRVILDCGLGFLEGSVSAIAQQSFPKKAIVTQVKAGRDWPLLAKLPAKPLSKLMARLVDYLSGVRREDWMLRLELGNGKLKAIIKVAQGRFEELMVATTVKREGVVEWPLEMVRPVLEYMGRAESEIRIRVDEEKQTPYLVSGGGIELMVARKKV